MRERAVEIVVKVRADLAGSLHRGEEEMPFEAQGLMDMASGLGVELEPVHPGSADPLLADYFRTEVEDASDAERIAAALRESPAVESAYVKPAAEPP